MAEYWKSAPRFWCKQCKIYIRDTAFEKTQHEATAKHQSNLKRFLREIHRDNERSQRDSQRAKNEVERLKSAYGGGGGAGASAGAGAGDSSSGSSWKKAAAAAAPAPAPQRPVSVEERKKQMAQLAEMGVAIPDAYRGDMALAGSWQTVSEKVVRPEEEAEKSTLGVRKRKHDADVDEEEEEAKREAERFESKGWGSRTRRYPGAEEDDGDLDALLASTKEVKKKGAGTRNTPEDAPAQEVKKEADSSNEPVKAEEPPADAGAGVVFKKRKPKAMKK